MSNLGLITLAIVASLIVFVESQKCSKLKDCGNGKCCVDGKCIQDLFDVCDACFGDLSCTDGCCIDFKCQPKSSYQCVEKNRCTKNSDCDSDCCKDNECQTTDVPCIVLPTFKLNDFLDKCSSATDCYTSSKGCCVNGHCRACPQNGNSYHHRSGSSGSSSSGRSTGASVGIVIAVIVLVILKIAFWVSWCSRRQRVVVVRRRVTCVAVPIVENDELQREHECVEQEMPDCPPPAYSPTAEPGDTQNAGKNPDQRMENNSEGYGVHQGPPVGPTGY